MNFNCGCSFNQADNPPSVTSGQYLWMRLLEINLNQLESCHAMMATKRLVRCSAASKMNKEPFCNVQILCRRQGGPDLEEAASGARRQVRQGRGAVLG